jgi:pantothenate kinase
MLHIELALRGQEEAPEELLHFRYRERFHMTEEELQNEPQDIFNLNTAIMAKEHNILAETARFQENQLERDNRL